MAPRHGARHRATVCGLLGVSAQGKTTGESVVGSPARARAHGAPRNRYGASLELGSRKEDRMFRVGKTPPDHHAHPHRQIHGAGSVGAAVVVFGTCILEHENLYGCCSQAYIEVFYSRQRRHAVHGYRTPLRSEQALQPMRLGVRTRVNISRLTNLAPTRVSGSSATTTYGKDVAMREHKELATLPSSSIFGKDRDERSRVFNALQVLISPAEALFSGMFTYPVIVRRWRASP